LPCSKTYIDPIEFYILYTLMAPLSSWHCFPYCLLLTGMLPIEVGTLPIVVGTLPIVVGTLPIEVGTHPMVVDTLPMVAGIDISRSVRGTLPTVVATLPIDDGMDSSWRPP
jgi:hypothetical protein